MCTREQHVEAQVEVKAAVKEERGNEGDQENSSSSDSESEPETNLKVLTPSCKSANSIVEIVRSTVSRMATE